MQNGGLVINTDGGARGNPGPAACAFVIHEGTEVLFSGSKFLGSTTNNDAEYKGVLLALEALNENPELLKESSVTFFLDSELVVKQLNGIYKIKNENLRNLYFQIFELIKKNKIKTSFFHVPREKNKDADKLVNEELDRNS